MKLIKHLLEFIFLVIVMIITNFIPFRFLQAFAASLTFLLWPFLASGRRRILYNVQTNMGWDDGPETKKFIRRNLVNQIRVTLEIAQAWKFKSKRFMNRHVNILQFDKINPENGTVIIEGHFGNWEIPGVIMRNLGYTVAYAAKEQSNMFTNWLIHNIRKMYGGRVVYMAESSSFIKSLRQKEIIGLVTDQDAGHEGIFVQFLGREASTYQGAALLSIIGKAELFLLTCTYAGKGKFDFRLELVHDYSRDAEVNNRSKRDALILEGTRKWTSALEKRVMEKPDQYFWLHRRWKTRPEGYRETQK